MRQILLSLAPCPQRCHMWDLSHTAQVIDNAHLQIDVQKTTDNQPVAKSGLYMAGIFQNRLWNSWYAAHSNLRGGPLQCSIESVCCDLVGLPYLKRKAHNQDRLLEVALVMWPISPFAGRSLIGLLACVHEVAAISECQGGPHVFPRRGLGAPRCPSFLSNSHAALKEEK